MRSALPQRDASDCGWVAALSPLPPTRRISAGQRADCVVIGAGFTGLAAARQLATHRPQWRVAVVDAQRVGCGASGRNSGFIVDVGHYQAGLGVDGNRRLLRLQRAGLEQLRRLVHAHALACAWTEGGRLHGAVADAGMRSLDAFTRGLDAMGEPYRLLDRTEMAKITGTTYYRAGARTAGTVTVQPAALVRGLAASLPPNVDLFEESPVEAVRLGTKVELAVAGRTVETDRLVLATNGHTPGLGFLRRYIFPMLTFASLTRVLTTREQAALGGESAWGLVPEERMGTTVRRTADQRILIRNTVRYRADAMITDTCRSRARQIHERAFLARFPMLGEIGFEYTWGGVLGVSLNGAHFFGQLADNLFATAGYNGVGVAMGTVAGTLLADLAVGADSDLLRDMLALPKPAWIPPEPLLGWAVRPALAWLAARAREEI